MLKVALVATVLVASFASAGCDKECGEGTHEEDGRCVPDTTTDGDLDGDVDGDGDADGDVDGDVDGDGDVDTDVDGDADTDTDNLAPCESGPDCTTERDELMALLEEDRAELCPDDELTRDSELDAVAQERSVPMAAAGSLTAGPQLRYRLAAHGFDEGIYDAGENAAYHDSVEDLEQFIWDYEDAEEPGVFPMRDRIGNCDFTLVGIGIAADVDGTLWATQTFYAP